MSEEDIDTLTRSAKVVVFRSPLTDLGGLDRLLRRRGIKWRDVQLGMADRENRARFELLRQYTGHPTLPQVFVDGRFVGGIGAARDALGSDAELDGPSAERSWPATLVAYAGLVPFVGLAAWMWARGNGAAANVVAIYAATVISFVGAVHWGWALAEQAEPRTYYWSTVPAVGAWVFASLPAIAGLPLLAALLAGVWYAERRWFARSLPRWYRNTRLQLTAVSAACLIAAWLAVIVHG